MAQSQLTIANPQLTTLYLDGSTPLTKRKQMVEAFQHGEAQVFFISLKAGGLGLNLTEANYVIHLDPWWNPAIEQQATDRAYRIGQKRNVTVYHLIAADTIEEKILRLHKTKRDLADALLQDQHTAHTLTLSDLKELLSNHS
jgi:SNF2 family DNA or RNA helicase